MAEAKRNVEAVRARGVSPEVERCLLITLGTLQFRENRADLAVASLTQAYRASERGGQSPPAQCGGVGAVEGDE
jgi:hypothetical protein